MLGSGDIAIVRSANNRLRITGKKVLYRLGYYHLLHFLNKSDGNSLLILMYHALVEDSLKNFDWIQRRKVSGSEFRSQVLFLSKHYQVVTLDAAIDCLLNSEPFCRPTVALTFDDGDESVYEIAWPILKEHGMCATIFPLTSWIDGTLIPWWLDLAGIVKGIDLKKVGIAEVEKAVDTDLGLDVMKLTDIETQRMLLTRLKYILQSQLPDRVGTVLSRLMSLMPPESIVAPELDHPLTWEEIREMSTAGMEFGAHTCSHVNLGLVSQEQAEQEILRSKTEIEKHTRKSVVGFAYPFGGDAAAYSAARGVLESGGFKYACTTIGGRNTHVTDRYLLKRSTLPATQSEALLGRELLLM